MYYGVRRGELQPLPLFLYLVTELLKSFMVAVEASAPGFATSRFFVKDLEFPYVNEYLYLH